MTVVVGNAVLPSFQSEIVTGCKLSVQSDAAEVAGPLSGRPRVLTTVGYTRLLLAPVSTRKKYGDP